MSGEKKDKGSKMTFLSTFDGIQKNFRLKPQEYIIDNVVFRLHYRFTVLMLLVCTILVTSRQYIGEHIRCIADKGVPEHVMNTFCFFTTTFTVVKHLDSKALDFGYIAHPGVGPYSFNSTEPIKRHAYYQWVPFVLFGQALMFYLTHLLWKKMEGGRLKFLVNDFKLTAFALGETEVVVGDKKIPSRAQREEKMQKLREVFLQRIYINRTWSLKLIICEILNFLHILLQIYITDKFLKGSFLNLGVEICKEGLEPSVDILDEVFPKITKCHFYKYGPSGSIQVHDAMCVMALNIINEKIYVMMWFWFCFLLICTGLGLIWRLMTILLHARSAAFNRLVFSLSCPDKANPWKGKGVTVSKHFNFTDWLFLSYLAKNLDSLVFKEFFMGLAEELEDRKPLITSENAD